MGQRYHLVEFQPWEGGPDTVVTLRAKAKLLKPAPLDSVSAPAVVSDGRDSGVSTDGGSASARLSTARVESTPAGAGAAQRVSRKTVAATRPRRRSARGAIKATKQSVSVDAGEAGGEQPPLATARVVKREGKGNEEAEEDDMEVDVEGEEEEEEEEGGEEDAADGEECRNRLREMISWCASHWY